MVWGRGSTSYVCMWSSSFPSTIYWRHYCFPIEWSWHPLENYLTIYIRIYYWAFYSIGLYVCLFNSYIFKVTCFSSFLCGCVIKWILCFILLVMYRDDFLLLCFIKYEVPKSNLLNKEYSEKFSTIPFYFTFLLPIIDDHLENFLSFLFPPKQKDIDSPTVLD